MAADDDNGDGTGLFDVHAASPLKNNDEGSLDIYAGLDSAVSDSTARSRVSFRNCLDLYEEILTEEGTAKEATYNDLQVEYGKCQRQMKDLMRRFEEIQTQNLSLKNENQSLKKNISALIKTARVEINRKDEEINHLHQRLSEFPHFRNNHKTTRTKDSRPKSPHLDDCAKTDHGVKSDVHKDVHPNTLQPNLEKEGKSHSEAQNPLHLPPGIEKHCTNNVWSRSHCQVGEGNSNEDNRRGRNNIRHSHCSRGTDRTQKDLNNSCSDAEPRDREANARLQGNPEKRGSSEARAESKSSEMKSSTGLGHKSERSGSSWEKETSRERSHTRVESQNDKSVERQNERLQNVHRKELQPQDKAERKGDMKFKPAGEDQGHRGRVERALPPHSKSDTRYHGSSKYHPEEKRGREDCRRDRGLSSHGFQDRRCSSSLSSNRNGKYPHSKEVGVAHQWENTSFKAERHRTEDRRKRERENKEESRHVKSDKKSPTEYLQRTNKEAKKSTADVKRQTETKHDKGAVSNNEVSKGTDNKECAMKGENGPNEVKSKDLKLSFMEKLNLTLSPAKKQPVCQDNQHQIISVPNPSGMCDSQSSEKTETGARLPSVGERRTKESKSELPELKEALPAPSQPSISIPENKMKQENRVLVKSVENTMPCEMRVCGTDISFPAPAETKQPRCSFPSVGVAEPCGGTRAAVPVVSDVLPGHALQDFGRELDTKGHDLNTCDISEGVKTKAVLSPNAAAASESLLQPGISLVNCSGDNNHKLQASLEDRTMVGNPSCPLEPCLPEETFICTPQKTEPIDHKIETGESSSVYQDDDNSVLSIDFNNLRPIPEAISPLNSPVRPVARVVSMESPCAVPLYDSGHKDEFLSISTHSAFKTQPDLNKENQKPVPKFDKCSETDSSKNLSLDELEEGEVRSDEEESVAQKPLEKSARPRASTAVQPANSSPGSRGSTVHVHKAHRSTAVRLPQHSIALSKRPNESRPSSTKRDSKTMSISSLEKILPLILTPSSVWEVMHMLRMLGKHVRKNYMKFKIKFSLVQFHRIIESAILSFTSLIKYLDLSKICQSVSTLQRRLCEVIESNLKQVKKNGIVDRLFEQQQTDMKKKLWKFVDEQLDYLFEKLKKILFKFCGSINTGKDNSEEKLGKKHKERAQHSNCHKRNMDNNKEIWREKGLKSEKTVNFKSSLGCEKSDEKHQGQTDASTSAGKHDVISTGSTCTDSTKECKEQLLEMSCPSMPKPRKHEENTVEETATVPQAGAKAERSFEILTEQQASSLTFNLVSDAQMGEIFKSLLQGSDLLDTSVNGTEKAEWEVKTAEKQLLESLKCEPAPACTTEELVPEGASLCPKVISDDNWSSLSSEKGPSISSGLSLPVHPDVLDENCMFEVSSNIALSKDNIYSSEKSKPCISSILLEDLAVSLTVPSPLKSDGHLSFLKPEVLSTATPEEVISAHFSEDALLEEEDASEQDIHLALESDNSSSKSSCSSWTSRSVTPGFQYHPNLPMHAVIMEKSNDHFIVKIRRAAPSTSSGLKHGMVAEESATSLPTTGKEADMSTEKESIPFQSPVLKSVEDLENSEKDVDSSKPTHEEQNSIVQTQVPDIYEFLKDASSKMGHCDQVVDDCFKLHQVWEPKVSENLQELPSVEKVPHSVDDHLPNTHIDLTRDPATETKSLGELMEVTVLNIDHLECSGTNLDQDAQIIGSSLQSNTVDTFIDLTHDASSESKAEGGEPVLAVEDLECQVICIDEDNHKEGKMGRANGPSECIVDETCIDLTPESPGSWEIERHALKPEPPSNLDCSELPGTLGNLHKKRKNSPGLNHSSQKKQRKDTDLTSSKKTKRLSQNSDRNGNAHRKQASKKREPTVSDTSLLSEASPGAKDSAAALAIFPTSLSAKNVIKKKGEIIVSWTRNDDREILLECQKRMPSLKTFTYLAAKLNKNPNQVSERFQQLKKLFEKSKCR